MNTFIERGKKQIHSQILTPKATNEVAKSVVTNIKAKLKELGNPIPEPNEEEEEEEEEVARLRGIRKEYGEHGVKELTFAAAAAAASD